MDDLISRRVAIDYCRQLINAEHRQGSDKMNYGQERVNQTETILHHLEIMPSAQLEIIHCEDCIYYDPPHVENDGMRLEYADLPKEALIAGLATCEYGINIGGRCTRDYNAGYVDDKRIYVPHDNFCGRAERRVRNE